MPIQNTAHRSPLTAHRAKPWYREPWPWLLMVAPLAAVAGGAVTLWLAVTTSDGLVAEDYYKQGLAINRTLSRDVVARARNLHARVVLGDGFNRVRVTLSGEALPDRLALHVVHPTRPGMDQTALLTGVGRGTYEAALQPLTSGRWQVTIEDEARSWRLAGIWQLPEQNALELAAP